MDLLGLVMHWFLMGMGLLFLFIIAWVVWRVDRVEVYEEAKRNGPPSFVRRGNE